MWWGSSPQNNVMHCGEKKTFFYHLGYSFPFSPFNGIVVGPLSRFLAHWATVEVLYHVLFTTGKFEWPLEQHLFCDQRHISAHQCE